LEGTDHITPYEPKVILQVSLTHCHQGSEIYRSSDQMRNKSIVRGSNHDTVKY